MIQVLCICNLTSRLSNTACCDLGMGVSPARAQNTQNTQTTPWQDSSRLRGVANVFFILGETGEAVPSGGANQSTPMAKSGTTSSAIFCTFLHLLAVGIGSPCPPSPMAGPCSAPWPRHELDLMSNHPICAWLLIMPQCGCPPTHVFLALVNPGSDR